MLARLDSLLSGASKRVKDEFKLDREGLWSLTCLDIGRKLANDLLELGADANSTVTDLMAGVGGLTIPFAERFSKVVAFERSTLRARMLEENMRLMGLDNVKTVADYYQCHSDQISGIVIFDPPWGKFYKSKKVITLHIGRPDGSKVSLEEAICASGAKYVVVKLPTNYDRHYFVKHTKQHYLILQWAEYEAPNSMIVLIMQREEW